MLHRTTAHYEQLRLIVEGYELDTYEYLNYARLNIELMFYLGTDGKMVVCARARPWRNSAEEGYMLLGTGPTADEALDNVAEAHVKGEWVVLDWKFRPGAAEQGDAPAPTLKKRSLPTSPAKPR